MYKLKIFSRRKNRDARSFSDIFYTYLLNFTIFLVGNDMNERKS